MKPTNIDATQDFPVMISDAAWNSILPFLRALPKVYVGNPEKGTVEDYLGGHLDYQRGYHLAHPPKSLWVLEHDLSTVRSLVRYRCL